MKLGIIGAMDVEVATLKEKMENAAESLEFEKAIEYRNMLNSLESLQDKQKMTLKK